MKKLIFLPLAAVLATVSCEANKAQKMVDQKPTRSETVAISPKTTGSKRISAEMIAEGKTIYENNCAKCHDLPNPAKHTDQQWVGLMNAMAPKAKLTAAQSELVYDYVTSKN